MEKIPVWQFDESKQIGVDYTNKEIVEEYDKQHEGFRDFKKETRKIASDLRLSSDSIVLDIACGTGGLSIHLAAICKHVYAVDVSEAMINIVKRKISDRHLENIQAIKSGLLTYEHNGFDLDAIISNIALHHLPDFWKQVALCKIYDLLKPGGKFFLVDVVFGFQPRSYKDSIEKWLISMRSIAGDKMAEETITHVRDEYSTWDWIMVGMLERAGFTIEKNIDVMENMKAYICSK